MEPTIYKPSIYKGAGIYKAWAEGGGGGGGEDLPEGYKKRLYIQSNGTSNIEITGNIFPVINTDKVKTIFSIKRISSSNFSSKYFNIRGDNNYDAYINIDSVSDKNRFTGCWFSMFYGMGSATNDNSNDENFYTALFGFDACNINGVNYQWNKNTSSGYIKNNFFYTNNGAIIKIFEAKLYDIDNNVKYDFIPCTNENEQVGLYEIITGNFILANNFIAGSEI